MIVETLPFDATLKIQPPAPPLGRGSSVQGAAGSQLDAGVGSNKRCGPKTFRLRRYRSRSGSAADGRPVWLLLRMMKKKEAR